MFQNQQTKSKPQQQQAQTKASTQQPQPQPLTPIQIASQIIPYFTFPLLILAVVAWKFNIGKRLAGLFFRSSTESDQHGTAGFAHVHEIKKLTAQFEPGNLKVGEVKDLKVLKQLVNLPKNLALMHSVIVGPTGSGKSRGFFLPNTHDAGKSSFIATDPKSELWHETAYNQHAPIRFAPTDPNNSAPFNFVAYCKDLDFAENVAAGIVHSTGTASGGDGKFWADAEEGLATALLVHIAHSEMPTPTHLYNLLTSGVETISEVLLSSEVDAARRLVAPFAEAKKDVKAGVIQGLSGKLRFLNNPEIRRFTSSDVNAFNFGQLREKPVQVYWCLKQHEVAKLQTLSTIFFSIIITQLLKQEKGKIPVNLFFDEFANIGKIKEFEKHITLFRAQGIAISAGVQDTSQLESLYGTIDAKTIIGNFNNKLFLHGISGEAAKFFSELLGNYTYLSDTESFSESGGWLDRKVTRSTGKKEHSRPLMTTDEIRRLEDTEIVLISTNLRPVRMKKLFFERPKAGFNKVKDFPELPPKKQSSMNFLCNQELSAPEYTRKESPAAAKKKSYDDI
jgi:type IV secretion system protein VirD4